MSRSAARTTSPVTSTTPEKATMTPFRRSAKILVTAALALAAGAAPLLVPSNAAADTSLVVDGFDRTVASGWGTPSTGGAWGGVVGGSSTSVANSEGKVSNILGGRSFKAYQNTISAENAEVRADFALPVSKDFQYTIESRKQADGSSYQARIRIDSTGKPSVELLRANGTTLTFLKGSYLNLAVPVGQKMVIKLATQGESPVVVKAKLFVADGTEPGWQLTTLDSDAKAVIVPGYAGLTAYNGPGNSAIDLTTQAFAVTDTTPAPVAPDPTPTGTPSGDPTNPADPTPTPAPKLTVSHGAGPVGSATYPAPSNALYVSPTGSDTGTGSLTNPFKTLAKALTKNSNGQTIVLRAGTYHESVIVAPNRAATIQPYPGEAVWFDGTRVVDGFTASGNAYKAPWNVVFDHSPTYTKGAPDGTAAGWQFVNPDYPMAAHPDMVWINNVEQKQVKTLGAVTAGTFFVDETYGNLYLGTDPTGKTVRAADLQSAFSLRAPGTVLRGFGIRRYADSVWQQGVVTSYYENMTLDNMTVRDSATGGIGMYRAGSTITNTTVDGSGQVGIQANQADGLVLDNVSVTDSNDEKFNPAPSAGGVKITQTRGVTLRNSEILRTTGNGFWTDQSTYNITVTGNEIFDGTRFGVVLEISSVANVINNIIANNAWDGVMIADTDKANIWNNTIINNRRAVAFAQDSRRIEQLNVSGHDPRRAQPDLTMPWVIGNSSVGNNVMAAGPDATAVLAVEAYELTFSAEDLKITTNGNVYSQTAMGVPNSAAVWARKGSQPHRFILLDDFRDNTGQEATGINPLMSSPVDTAYQPKASIAGQVATVAQPLPSDVATKASRTAGEKYLGAFPRTSQG